MRARLNYEYYSRIKNLSFAPDVSIVNDSLPINEFSVDVITENNIEVGVPAELVDDSTADPWLYGNVVFAERIDKDTVSVRAQSRLRLLDYRILPQKMYSNESLTSVLDYICTIGYDLDESFDGLTVSGYAPEQTARERLQWICLYIGAYVRSCAGQRIQILPLAQTTDTLIPMEKTFWKPSLSYGEYVSELHVTAYTFTSGTPTSDDETVKVGGVTYIITKHDHYLANPTVPSGIEGKVVKIDGVFLISETNFNDILNRMALIHFNRITADVDVINNREYFPGDLVQFCIDEDRMASGYIESCNFSFGVQARARLKINGVEELESAKLLINYIYKARTIKKSRYRFPVGYVYNLENEYPDISGAKHRYVYAPKTQYCTGTIVDGTNEQNVECYLALHFFFENGALLVLSVSEMSESEGVVTIE